MKQIILIITISLSASTLMAQQFINKGEIEYEVNTNIKKTMSNDSWDEKMKENMSDFMISYYKLSFSENKSIYSFSRWSEKTKVPKWYKDGVEENSWYADYNTSMLSIQKQVQGTNFIIADSIPKIKWKLSNESREIAGFNCRKAVGKIMDSVYVFAFYTDEITITGGPCSISGLPGVILGLTIPRLYTSFIATKISVNNVNVSAIKPITAKKMYTYSSMKKLIEEKTEDWFRWGDDEAENKRLKNLFIWNTFL